MALESSKTASRKIARAASLITAGNAASRVLGLVRESVIALVFGASGETSAFRTAATVPTMVYDLVIGGAVSAALIPVFSEYATEDGEEGRRAFGKVVGSVALVAFVLLAATTALLVLFAPTLTWVLTGGAGSPSAQPLTPLTVHLVRLVIPSVLFLGLSSVVTAALYARQEFAFPAFAAATYNLGIIAGALLLGATLGPTGLVIGVLLGAFLQLALQLVGLRGSGLRLGVDLRHPAIRRILKLYAPIALGLIVTQVGIVIDRWLAWRTGPESVAVMGFATTLYQLPLGLIATATSFAVLPQLSRFAQEPDGLKAFKRTLGFGLRLALLAIVPATVAVVVLRVPLIQLLFQRGAFDSQDTLLTASALLFYSPQLPFVAIDQLLLFAFYARRNTLTPALVGLFGVGVYLVAALLLTGPGEMGLRGLVLANTLQNSLHAVVLLVLLWRAIGPLLGDGVGRAAVKSLVAAAPMAIACWVGLTLTPLDRGLPLLLAGLLLTLAVSGGVYALALALQRSEELAEFWALVSKRVRG